MNAMFVTVPHSGEEIPIEATWLTRLSDLGLEPILMCDVDRYVDQLYRPGLEGEKIAAIFARWHRYVVDLNRLPEDIDASTVQGNANPAGKFGRGFHWQHTTLKDVLMPQPMSPDLHLGFVKKYFDPFHAQIATLVAGLRAQGASQIYHLDLHSMPSLGTSEHNDPGQSRADLVISDQKGTSCRPELKDLVLAAFKDQGFSTAYNWPYYGGRITQTYGRPADRHHTIQVELNRKLYMDEQSKHAHAQLWPSLQKRLGSALRQIHQGLKDLDI
jgi:N-formylglutamate deformylase